MPLSVLKQTVFKWCHLIEMKNIHFSYTDGFFVLIAVLLLVKTRGLALPFILAATVHELGHLAAICALGGTITGICFTVSGIKIEYNSACLSYVREFMCIIAGPVFGLLTAIAAAHFNYNVFAGISFTFSIFNLLPAKLLDGGQAVFCITKSFLPLYTAEKISYILDAAVTTVILCGGIYTAILTKGNLTLLFMGIIMLFAIVKNEEIV